MKIQRLGKLDRYVVVDHEGRFWAGVCWASFLREARVFAEREQAEKVIHVLGQQAKDIEKGKKFIAQVVVTTSSNQWVSLEELQETLARHVNIFNQIEDDLLVLDVEIDWDSLREQLDD
jgi:hypothetical protein